jgi:putative redox protein
MSSAAAHASGRTASEPYRFDIDVRDFDLIADEPVSDGGQNLGPTAVELVAAALTACTATTLKMYAARKGWDLQSVDVHVALSWRDMSCNREITLTG